MSRVPLNFDSEPAVFQARQTFSAESLAASRHDSQTEARVSFLGARL